MTEDFFVFLGTGQILLTKVQMLSGLYIFVIYSFQVIDLRTDIGSTMRRHTCLCQSESECMPYEDL